MSLEIVILDLVENARKQYPSGTVLNLGGASGPGGGVGGPPAGITGKLTQSRVAYDETESESSSTPVSGASLITNLDHIRYRLSVLEASGVGGDVQLTVKWDGVTVTSETNTINFVGDGVEVTDVGGVATVTISGGTSGGEGHTIQNEGSDLTPRSKLNFKGPGVDATDNSGNDATDVTFTVAVALYDGEDNGPFNAGTIVFANSTITEVEEGTYQVEIATVSGESSDVLMVQVFS